MADTSKITLPDVGDFKDIEVIEVLIAVGDEVEAEQSIIVLESDKATMEIPSPGAGRIEAVAVKVGDRLNEGDEIASLSGSAATAPAAAPEQPAPVEPEPASFLSMASTLPAATACSPGSASASGRPARRQASEPVFSPAVPACSLCAAEPAAG